ncbi:MAG: hypothetical protein KatS3mg009_0008 [Acidimicrobiia bacterium]|nr:MAG: hypothetical protein KatS3mg009_0008 [Acidimicrobiia bacterium]
MTATDTPTRSAAPTVDPPPGPAGPAPAARRPGASLQRWLNRRSLVPLGRAITAVGIVIGGFLAYELVASDLQHRRAQAELRREFAAMLRVAAAGDAATTGDEEVPEDLQDELVEQATGEAAEAAAQAAPGPIAPGTPVAVLEVRRLGITEVVVAGTTPELLKRGPGHFRNTPLPGERGNAVVAGRRTTYGAPFRRLDALRVGDEIVVTTTSGRFTYVVEEPPGEQGDDERAAFTVEPGDADVISDAGDNRLTLISSDPRFLASRRLAVVAGLEGRPGAPLDVPRPTVIGANESALAGDASGWVGVLLWGQLLVLAIAGGWVWSRRGDRRSAWLVTVPVVLALTLLWYESLDRLLPATL